MSGLLGYFVRHRTAANLVLVAMLLAGLWGGLNIRAQFFPDVIIERITVSVAWPGAGPEEVDGQIIETLEPALLAVEGVESTVATARAGRASVVIEFEPGWDMGRAAEEVRAAADALTTLPDAAERPEVRRSAFRDRVTDVVIHGPVPVEQLSRYAAELQAALLRMGVTRTSLAGAPDPAIEVEVPELALVRHGLELRAIGEAVGAAVRASPAGVLGDTGLRATVGQDRLSLEAIAGAVVRGTADGAPLTLRDIAEVRLVDGDSGSAFSVGGQPAVRLAVDRAEGGDAIAMQRAVEQAAASLAPTLPEGVEITLSRTRAQGIADRLTLLVNNGIVGLGFVLLFLFLFLSARTAFWVAAGIPAAMAASIGLMYLAGLSLNMMSLFALILCLGIVVDDAIVVGEHADTLARRGASPAEAAERAARRMFAPVLAASITSIIAFLGLVAVGGRFGSLILAIPLTVTMVLVASLLESFLVLPAHMRHALAARRETRWYDAPSRLVDRGFRRVRDGLFRPLIGLVIRLRYPVLGGLVALMLVSVTLLVDGTLRWRFFEAPESGLIVANFAMVEGSRREDTVEMLAALEAAVAEVDARFAAEHGIGPVTFALGRIGGTHGRGLADADGREADLLGGLQIELLDPDRRPYTQNEVLREIEAAVPRLPRLDTLALRGERSGPGGDAISVALSGTDVRVLKAAAERLKADLAVFEGVSGLEDSLARDADELRVRLNPQGEALGLTTADLARTLRERLTGIEAASFAAGARTATVTVRLPEAALTADYLDRAWIRAPGGAWLRLGEVATVERAPGFGTIRRENGQPVVTVTGEIAADDAAAAAAVTEALESRLLPELAEAFDVQYRLTGLREQEQAFLRDALIGFLMCLAGIYVTLAWIFASWARPLAVLLVIPLGLIGVLWGHHWMGTALSMFSVVGLLGMSGIIVNDAIVLVTSVDEAAKRRAFAPAMIEAVGDRLRPVFLTTATTVAGLAPLLFERSTQAQFLKPTVITLVFGLGFGMVLVLIAVPAILAVGRDIGRMLTAARRLVRLWTRGRRRGLGSVQTAA